MLIKGRNMDNRFINQDYARRSKVWVVVATHKLFDMPNDKMYIPLHVGAEGKVDESGKPLDFGFQKDNTGDNISNRNAQFCELTGLYWAWKNLDAQYIGLVHYRRYFKGIGRKEYNSNSNIENSNKLFDKILTYKQFRPLMDKYKIVVPKKRRYYIETLEQHYAHNHYIEELNTAKEVMLEKYPEYADAYDRALGRTWGYMFNMMIMKKDLLDEYCTWLFDILFEMTDRLCNGSYTSGKDGYEIEKLSSFENRFPGRVSERIFNVWLEYQMEVGKINKADIKEIPFMYMEKINIWNKGVTFLKAKFIGKKPEKSF